MKNYFWIVLLSICVSSTAQEFTRADTLRGSITPERAWWDVMHYDLKVTVNPSQKYIEGNNTISYKVISESDVMQIDLQAPMRIDKAMQNGKEIVFTSEGNAHFLKLRQKQQKGKELKITIHFSGKPREA